MPEHDAEGIVQDAVLSLLSTCSTVIDPKAWLVGATSNASRAYWRRSARNGDTSDVAAARGICEPSDEDTFERLERVLLLRKVLAGITSRHREILRLHYYEQLSASEMAKHLGTTHGYAEKLIGKALKEARHLYSVLARQGP